MSDNVLLTIISGKNGSDTYRMIKRHLATIERFVISNSVLMDLYNYLNNLTTGIDSGSIKKSDVDYRDNMAIAALCKTYIDCVNDSDTKDTDFGVDPLMLFDRYVEFEFKRRHPTPTIHENEDGKEFIEMKLRTSIQRVSYIDFVKFRNSSILKVIKK